VLREFESLLCAPPALPGRVGALGRSAKPANANGVPSRSPGLPRSGYPGVAVMMLPPTPTGLRPPMGRGVDGTPLGFDVIGDDLPRVGARSSRQPWAGGPNAFSVRRIRYARLRTGAEPGAPPNPAPRFAFDVLREFESLLCAPPALPGRVGALGRSTTRHESLLTCCSDSFTLISLVRPTHVFRIRTQVAAHWRMEYFDLF
jgi:hypothetical protein